MQRSKRFIFWTSKILILRKTSASIDLYRSFQTNNTIFTTNKCEKCQSIQYTVRGFEPTTFRTRVVSHNHQTRVPAQRFLLYFGQKGASDYSLENYDRSFISILSFNILNKALLQNASDAIVFNGFFDYFLNSFTTNKFKPKMQKLDTISQRSRFKTELDRKNMLCYILDQIYIFGLVQQVGIVQITFCQILSVLVSN